MKNIKFRKNIEELQWYSCGKWEFTWEAEIFLDTNESSYDLGWLWNNRYPDPMQIELKKQLVKVKKEQLWVDLKVESIMIDSGSDNIIDLLVRIFCEPWEDSLGYFSPTFWMYKVAADINNVWIVEFELDGEFNIKKQDLEKIYLNNSLKLLFICNPNNPTWNISLSVKNIEDLLKRFNWILVVDEAYIDFCPEYSATKLLEKYNNIVVLQTFSKLWWLAGVRCWMAFSSPEIIEKLNTVKAPYNVNILTQKVVVEQLRNSEVIFDIKNKIVSERKKLKTFLEKLSYVKKVFKSDANFLLVQCEDWQEVYEYLRKNWIIVRNFSDKKFTKNCLRMSIGNEVENLKLREVLNKYN